MKYFILINDDRRGPMEIAEMEELGLNPSSDIWAPGFPDWKPADSIPEFQKYFQAKASKIRQAKEEERKKQEMSNAKAQTGAPVAQTGTSVATPALTPKPTVTATVTPQPSVATASVTPPTPSSPVTPPPPTATEWYMGMKGRQLGPFTREQLVPNGLQPDTLVWCESMEYWTPAAQVTDLNPLFATQTPSAIPSTQSGIPVQSSHNPYTTPIIGCVLLAIYVFLTQAVIRHYFYFSAYPSLITLIIPSILIITSFIYASGSASACKRGDMSTHHFRAGAALGSGIGSILYILFMLIGVLTLLS